MTDRTSSSMRHFAGYGRYTHGGSRFALLGGGSGLKNETLRSVMDGISSSMAQASYDGSTMFSRAEYGYTFSLGKTVSVEPQAGFQYARVTIDGFTEEGAGVLNLVTPERNLKSQRSTLGGRAIKTFERASAADTRIELRAAWAHEFSPLGSVRIRFLGDDAGNNFDLASPARIENSAIVGATFAGELFKRVRFLTSVDGNVGSAVKLWTASVGIRAVW